MASTTWPRRRPARWPGPRGTTSATVSGGVSVKTIPNVQFAQPAGLVGSASTARKAAAWRQERMHISPPGAELLQGRCRQLI